MKGWDEDGRWRRWNTTIMNDDKWRWSQLPNMSQNSAAHLARVGHAVKTLLKAPNLNVSEAMYLAKFSEEDIANERMRQRWTITMMDHDNNGQWQMTMMVEWWRWRDGGEQWWQFPFNNQLGREMTMVDDDDKTTTMDDNDDDNGPRRWWTMIIRQQWTMMMMWWDETKMNNDGNGPWQ